MPIETQYPLQAMDRQTFGRLSYTVVGDLIAIHNSLGRLFEESVYKQSLRAVRIDALLEVWIDVSHATFRKRYFVDVLVQLGGMFEIKTVESLAPAHRAQLLHYLMLCGLSHGMLINIRPEQIEREYINNVMSLEERRRFSVVLHEWDESTPSAKPFRELVTTLLSDWGTCLELPLYEDAIIHFFGGHDAVTQRRNVRWNSQLVSSQPFRMVAPTVAFMLTALEDADAQSRFTEHVRRMLGHVELEAVLWANIARHQITFSTLRPRRLEIASGGQRDAGRKIEAEK